MCLFVSFRCCNIGISPLGASWKLSLFVRDYTTQSPPRVRPRPRCRMAAVNFNQSVFISPGVGGGAAR